MVGALQSQVTHLLVMHFALLLLFQATLMRNIPSAVLRFTVYEELKQIFVLDNDRETQKTGFNLKLFLAGAAAGAVSSGLSK